MTLSEKAFETEFVRLAQENYPNRVFINSFELPYDEEVPKGVAELPWYIIDVLEIDEDGNFHLWEHKLFNSRALYCGYVIGQLICYDFLFNTTAYMKGGAESLQARIINAAEKRGYARNHPALEKVAGKEEFKFSSWNIVACGGIGFEFAALYNNIVWHLYSGSEFLSDDLPEDRNFWHFYETADGFDLRNLWELSAMHPKYEVPDKPPAVPFIFDNFDIETHHNLHCHYTAHGLHKQAWEAHFDEPVSIEDAE